MKQKVVLHRNGPSKQLPKSLQDENDHNFTVYYCLKDDSKNVNVKPMIMFVKSKDSRLRNISLIEISEVEKKDYKHKVCCLLIKCNSNQYVVFKHYFENAMKKYIVGKIEATQKDVEKYAL